MPKKKKKKTSTTTKTKFWLILTCGNLSINNVESVIGRYALWEKIVSPSSYEQSDGHPRPSKQN
jgi:hypothetical protein